MIIAETTIRFNETSYFVNENDGQLQAALILSNQVSYIISVVVRSDDKSATG